MLLASGRFVISQHVARTVQHNLIRVATVTAAPVPSTTQAMNKAGRVPGQRKLDSFFIRSVSKAGNMEAQPEDNGTKRKASDPVLRAPWDTAPAPVPPAQPSSAPAAEAHDQPPVVAQSDAAATGRNVRRKGHSRSSSPAKQSGADGTTTAPPATDAVITDETEAAAGFADTAGYDAPGGEAGQAGTSTAAGASATVNSMAHAPEQPGPSWRQMREQAERHTALARQVVSRCKTEGGQPQLSQLLTESSWKQALGQEFSKPYFKTLQGFVEGEWKGSKAIYPPKDSVFRALNSCPLPNVRVVILGQDPYHTPNTAMGLCFSVNKGNRVPPSLVNIYKEAAQDCGCTIPSHGDLSKWTYQGVLLLNTVLTVRGGEANSHKKRGWETFTDAVIMTLCRQRAGIVFLLWGKPAQEKEKLVNASPKKHFVLKAPHPSPLAAASGQPFVGCRHFSQANALLEGQGLPPIDWQVE